MFITRIYNLDQRKGMYKFIIDRVKLSMEI